MALCSLRFQALAETEESFPVLTIGTRTYTNVTVTTKAKKYVMLMHSEGLANIKVSELSPELRQTLGYRENPDEKPKSKATEAANWAKKQLGSFNVGKVNAMEANLRQQWEQKVAAGELPGVGKITPQMVRIAAAAAVVLWIIYCACLRTICVKTGKPPGILIWLPLFQIFPALKAAGMSPWWILGCPVGITQLVWPFKIAKARGKGGFAGFCLLFPPTSLFAFLYLTFADGGNANAPKGNRRVQVMKFETA
jgi:hypothetical protein